MLRRTLVGPPRGASDSSPTKARRIRSPYSVSLACGSLVAAILMSLSAARAADKAVPLTLGVLSEAPDMLFYCHVALMRRTNEAEVKAGKESKEDNEGKDKSGKRADIMGGLKGINAGTIAPPRCWPAQLDSLEGRLIGAADRAGKQVQVVTVGGSDLDTLAKGLIEAHVAMVVALGTPAALAAKRASSTTPIVMVGISDPVKVGLVSSLARPGGNVTGVSFLAPELAGKGLEFLSQVLPTPSRVGVLWNPVNSGRAVVLQALKSSAETMGITLTAVEARRQDDIGPGLDAARAKGLNGLFVVADPLFSANRTPIVEWARQAKLPSAFQLRDYTEAGGLMSYGPSESEIYDRAVDYVRRILQGANPADLPIQQPTRFSLVLNLKTAKLLGLAIPSSLLERADQAIDEPPVAKPRTY